MIDKLEIKDIELAESLPRRLYPLNAQRKSQRNAVFQSEQQRIIVVQLLRMLNTSQQFHDDNAIGRRQLRKVMLMLNRERKIQSNIFAVSNRMTERLKERKEKEIKEIRESFMQRIEETQLTCETYVHKNSQLHQQLLQMKRIHSEEIAT